MRVVSSLDNGACFSLATAALAATIWCGFSTARTASATTSWAVAHCAEMEVPNDIQTVPDSAGTHVRRDGGDGTSDRNNKGNAPSGEGGASGREFSSGWCVVPGL